MLELLKKQKTILISSIGDNNLPHISYSPFFMKENKVYIYISRIAEHYKNLEENKNASLLVIEDESESKILFARNRITLRGTAKKVASVDEDVLKGFEEIHTKNMMDTLSKMDFSFFEIEISDGRLVEGFGKAFELKYNNGKWETEHVTFDGAGHGRK